MSAPEITLRLASMDDALLLLAWRNDQETRSQSISQDEISQVEHMSWLKRSLESKTRTIFIAEAHGQAIGTIRLDNKDNDQIELSWTIGREFRGKGYGRMILDTVCRQNDHQKLLATIRSENTASMSMAKKCGFLLKNESDGITYWERPAHTLIVTVRTELV